MSAAGALGGKGASGARFTSSPTIGEKNRLGMLGSSGTGRNVPSPIVIAAALVRAGELGGRGASRTGRRFGGKFAAM